MLLLILKIIGIILAVLLGLALLLVCIVLFVPVRYKANVQKAGEETAGQIKVSWLFHGVTVTLDYQNKKMGTVIRILGINLQWLKGLFHKKKKSDAVEKKESHTLFQEPLQKECEQEANKENEELTNYKISADKSITDESITDESITDESITGESVTDKTIADEQSETAVPRETVSENSENEENLPIGLMHKRIASIKKVFKGIPLIFRKIIEIIRFVFSIPAKLIGTFRKISSAIKDICGKINDLKTFLRDERTKAALRCIKNRLIRILKHILPKRLNGEVRFGFEDPCTTGQLLAGIYMFYPVYQEHINIYPDFENRVLEGNLKLKGRICLSVLLWHALMLFIDEDFKYVLNILLHKEEL